MFCCFHHSQLLSMGNTVILFGWGQCLAIICDDPFSAFLYLKEDRPNSYSTHVCVENIR